MPIPRQIGCGEDVLHVDEHVCERSAQLSFLGLDTASPTHFGAVERTTYVRSVYKTWSVSRVRSDCKCPAYAYSEDTVFPIGRRYRSIDARVPH